MSAGPAVGAPVAGGTRPDRPRRLLAAAGDAGDPRAMSGLPYHFQLYGRRAGLVDGSATRSAVDWRMRAQRVAWNAWRAATLRGHGGYQYTAGKNALYWPPERPAPDDVVINIFQLYPRPLLDGDHRRWFFIDQTLTQLWDTYGQRGKLSRGVAERAMAWEREGYARAEGVIVNSTWAQQSVVADYGVPVERTAVVLQAANLEPDGYDAWAARHTPAEVGDGPLRLVFVGNDWRRKGLDRLLHAVARVNAGRQRVQVDVLGLTAGDVPPELAAVRHVTWHGFVDKRRDQDRMLDLLGRADVGCLLSRAEAGGNCLREFHATGLAVLGTSAGGAGEQVIADAAWLVAPDESVDEVADRLRHLAGAPDEVAARKARSWAQRTDALWPATLADVDAVLRSHGG